MKNYEAVARSHQRLGGILRVRHQPHHIAAFVQNARDVAQGAIRIFQIAQHDAIFGFQLIERALIGDVAAFAVRDGNQQALALVGFGGKRRISGFHPQRHVLADEFQTAIAHQRARQQPALHQNLKAVADAQHQPAVGGEFADALHDGRKLGDGSAAQIIAVGKTAGKDQRIHIAEVGGIVPDEFGVLPENVRDGIPSVVIAIAAGKHDDAKLHRDVFIITGR